MQHSVGHEGYVLDIGVGSWAAGFQFDTHCFLLSGPSDSQPVIVQGVVGVRRTGAFAECQGGAQAVMTEYDFTTNSRRYYFTYMAWPDAVPLSDFDLMVMGTASFSA